MIRFITFILISFLYSHSLAAQTSFFNLRGSNPPPLNSAQQLKYNRVTASTKFQNTYRLTLNNFLSLVGDEGKLRIDLPGDDCGLMEYSFLRSEFNSLTDFEWVGIVKNIELCECASGTFTFVNENGNQFGLITSDHYSYELHNLSGGEFLLGKINDTLVSRQLCKSNGSSNFNDNEPSIVERNGICKTRVLFLYTDAATTAPGISNLDAEARISITNLKTALISSGITSGEVDLEYAGLIHYPGFTETSNDIDIDLTELYTSPFVQNLRNLNFADMVVLLTEGNYFDANGSGGTIFGAVAEEPTPTGKRSSLGIPQDDLSYAIVEAEFTNVKYNTSHELGHLFGCRHQIEDDSHGTIEHGFSFRACNVWPFKKNWFTIMHTIRSEPGTTLGNQNGRLGQFSNPNIKFKGITTGTTNHNNNAQHIRNNSCSVANFRNNTALFSAFISGPDVLCENETVQLNSTVQNGLAPITLNWSYTINGTTFISLGGSANVSFS